MLDVVGLTKTLLLCESFSELLYPQDYEIARQVPFDVVVNLF